MFIEEPVLSLRLLHISFLLCFAQLAYVSSVLSAARVKLSPAYQVSPEPVTSRTTANCSFACLAVQHRQSEEGNANFVHPLSAKMRIRFAKLATESQYLETLDKAVCRPTRQSLALPKLSLKQSGFFASRQFRRFHDMRGSLERSCLSYPRQLKAIGVLTPNKERK